jgi:hypothetical protein
VSFLLAKKGVPPMSNAVFPNLLGMEWPVTKTPKFNTLEHKSVTGMRKALSFFLFAGYLILGRKL